jgi:hypothetical protein
MERGKGNLCPSMIHSFYMETMEGSCLTIQINDRKVQINKVKNVFSS